MRQDNSHERDRRRAELQAQLGALETKRDMLLARLAAQRLEPARRDVPPSVAVRQAAVLQMLESTLRAVQPTLAMATSARDELIADRALAERANDAASVDEATKLLDEITAVITDSAAMVARLSDLADSIRASTQSRAADAQGNEAG